MRAISVALPTRWISSLIRSEKVPPGADVGVKEGCIFMRKTVADDVKIYGSIAKLMKRFGRSLTLRAS
jgi:hypothetical protein